LVLSFEQVKGTHNIRSRGSQNALYIDLHLLVEPRLSIEESHYLVHDIERFIRTTLNKNIQVIAHLEPYKEVISKTK
ncbi:MAG: cation transporter dimerization domain-containing protein, partial [Sedimentibacter sp.]